MGNDDDHRVMETIHERVYAKFPIVVNSFNVAKRIDASFSRRLCVLCVFLIVRFFGDEQQRWKLQNDYFFTNFIAVMS